MHREEIAVPSAGRLEALAADHSGWKFGLGGSGHWWAVRGNDFVRARSPEELEAKLEQHVEAHEDG
jgi:hypothetical protein